MHYYDAHTHINHQELYDLRSEYLSNFYKIGGRGIVNIGIDLISSQLAIDISKENIYSDLSILATIGIHPSCISENNRNKQNIDTTLTQLDNIYINNNQHISAIGEIGTDLHRPCTPEQYKLQLYMFDQQCQLARKYNLPIVIHSRDDREGSISILQKYQDLKIYMHCWGYGPDQIQYLYDNFLSDNIYIGFAGNVTYPKATSLQDSLVLAYQNNMNILTETDAPYLKAQIIRGSKEPNQPEYISYIYDFIANKLGIGLLQLQKISQQNWKKLYNK